MRIVLENDIEKQIFDAMNEQEFDLLAIIIQIYQSTEDLPEIEILAQDELEDYTDDNVNEPQEVDQA